MRDDDDLRLHHKRDWLNSKIEAAMRKRRYERLPAGHPDFDAEDLPHWWQRWIAEGVGVIVLLAILGVAVIIGEAAGPALPWALDRLTDLLR